MGIRGGGRATQKKVRLLGLFLVDSLRRDLYSRAIGACLSTYLEHSVKALVKIDPLHVDVYERAVLRAARLSSAPLCALADAHGDARTPELVYLVYGGDKPRVMAFVCKTPRDASELVDCAKLGLAAAAATAKAGGFVDRHASGGGGERRADETARSDSRRQRPTSPDARSSLSEPSDRPAYRRYASQKAKRSSSEHRGGGGGANRSGDSAAYSSDSAAFDGVRGRAAKQSLSRTLSQPVTGVAVPSSGSHAVAGARPTFGRRRSVERAQPEPASASHRRGAATLDCRLRTSYDYIRQRPTAAYCRETSEDDSAAVDSPTYEDGRSLAFASYAEDRGILRLNPASSGARLTGSHRYARTTSYDQGAAADGRSAVHWKPVDRRVLGSTVQRTISMQ